MKRIVFAVTIVISNSFVCLAADVTQVTNVVVVEKLSKVLPTKEDAVSQFLWSRFAKKPEEKQFDYLTTEDWKNKAKEFENSLVAKAKSLNLDADALGKCLRAVPSEAPGLACVPVGAYFTVQNKTPVWIIVFKWEALGVATQVQKLEHVRIYAYDSRKIRKVGFVTCR